MLTSGFWALQRQRSLSNEFFVVLFAEAPAAIRQLIEPPSEKEIIEAALAKTRGWVSGPSGAAAKLGVPPSTLDHGIKALKINKKRFKFG